MSLIVKECSMVCPAEETPKQSLKLSRLDVLVRMPFSHNNVIYIYHPQDTLDNNISSNFFDTDVLKGALSRLLVSFYPLAGRLRENEADGEIEVNCNEEGVFFIEAETSHSLADFGDEDGDGELTSNGKLRKMVIPTWDYSKGLSSIPLVMVQLTRFKCGGVCMGVAHHHHIGDGHAYGFFMSSWTRLTRGLDPLALPVFARSSIHELTPRDPPQVNFRHLEFEPRLPPLPPCGSFSSDAATIMERNFNLSKPQIDDLKLEAASQEADQGYSLSTFDVVAGHVWRCACKVRGLPSEQSVKLYIPIDARSRLKDPTLPKGYYGNLVFFVACIANAGDIVHKPLWYSASKIHEALEKTKDVEYLKSAMDYLESQPDPMVLFRGADSVTCPNLLINSWGRIPFFETDFGWGQPKFFGHGGVRSEGLGFLIPTPHGYGSFTLSINLFAVHMLQFEKCLYDIKTQK